MNIPNFNWDNLKIFVEEYTKTCEDHAFTGNKDDFYLVIAMAYLAAKPESTQEEFWKEMNNDTIRDTVFTMYTKEGNPFAMPVEQARTKVEFVGATRLDK